MTDGAGPLRFVIDGVCVSGRGAELNGSLFFAASDQARGALWKTDGTSAGTVLVKRLGGGDPGVSASARFLTTINDRVYFSVDDGIHGEELWASNGTQTGTAMVADATPGPTGTLGFSSSIVGAGNNIFFTNSNQLWRSDGTAPGTVPLADVYTYPSSFATIGTTLYFIGNGQELWKSDGTPAGTGKVADAPSGEGLTAVNGMLFFRACDVANGCELWKSDGTAPGTAIVKDVTPGSAGSVGTLTRFGNALLFVSSPDSSTIGLWRSDGSNAGTTLLANLPGQVLSSAVGGGSFFLLTNSQLWVSDGSVAGTHVVRDVPLQATSGAGGIPDFRMMVLGDVVVFGLKDNVGGVGTYRSDGSAAGTRPLGPLVAAANNSMPGRLIDANGTLFFSADDGVHGFELWASNGTPESTRLVKDINPGPDGSFTSGLFLAGGLLFFPAFTPAGLELWRSDGTEAGTFLVKDIAPGAASSAPGPFGTRGDLVLFNASTEEGGPRALWRSDGTDAGTFFLGGVLSTSRFVDWRGAAYFLGSYQGVDALWRTDGSMLGTSAVAVLGGSSDGGIAVVRDTLVFFSCDPAHGCEPWKSDGTAAGTTLLLDVNPGTATNFFSDFLSVGDVAMFWADDGVHGREPWVTDGTEAGTRLLADIFPGPAASVGIGTAAVGGLRLFVANDGAHGFELWKTDGTPQGTALVRDINPGPANAFTFSSFAEGFRDVWFFATDGLTGEELWRSDGTAAGTLRVTDLYPGPGSSTIHPILRGFDRIRRSGSRMFFVGDDGTSGFELWSVPIPTAMNVISPCRLLDTRVGAGLPLTDGESRRFTAAGACGIPRSAGQVIANITVVDPTANGSLEVGPGGPWRGLGTVAITAGRTRANNSIFATGTDGSAAAKLSAPGGSAHLVVDVSGYLQ